MTGFFFCLQKFEFQDYVKNGYVSKVLGYEDKSIEAYLKPNSVGAFKLNLGILTLLLGLLLLFLLLLLLSIIVD